MAVVLRFAMLVLFVAQPLHATRQGFSDLLDTEEAASANAVQAANVTLRSIAGALLTQGTTIANRYKLTSLIWPGGDMYDRYDNPKYLGQGAFGAAYLAEDKTKENKLVVVKVFFTEKGALLTQQNAKLNPGDSLRHWMASRECVAAKLIQNARTDFPAGRARWMRCLEDGIDHAGAAYAVYEYLGSTNLKQYLDKMRAGESISLNSIDTMILTKQLIEGLVQIQGKFVHRDIKPENIMIKVTGTQESHTVDVKYIDFGMITADGAAPEMTAGSLPYMPPEFMKNPNTIPTNKFDVWSLGMTLYEMFCGLPLLHLIYLSLAENNMWAAQQQLMNGADPKKYCSVDTEFANLFWFISNKTLPFQPSDRQDPETLNSNPGWNSVVTTYGDEASKYPILALGDLELPAIPWQEHKPKQSELSRLLGPTTGNIKARPGILAPKRQMKPKVHTRLLIKPDIERKYKEQKAQKEEQKAQKEDDTWSNWNILNLW